MDTLKTLGLAVVASVIVVALGFTFFPGRNGSDGTNGQNGKDALGALAGPDIASPYLRWGGVAYWGGRMDTLYQASTTVCAIQAPSSTSTLTGAMLDLDVLSTTTTGIITIAKSNASDASTTLIGASTLAANVKDTIFSSTTATQAYNFGPNQYLTFTVKGQAQFYPTGRCWATWKTVQ